MEENKRDEGLFIVSEAAQRFLQKDKDVKAFESIPYTESGETVSLLKCINTMAKAEDSRLDLESGQLVLSMGERKFIIESFCCPEPNFWDESISIELISLAEDYRISYHFENDEKDLKRVRVEKRDADGKYVKAYEIEAGKKLPEIVK